MFELLMSYPGKITLPVGTWIKLTDFPGTAVSGGSLNNVDGKLYFFGGGSAASVYPRTMYYLDAITFAWVKMTDCPAGSERTNASSVVCGKKIYYMNGSNSGGWKQDMVCYDTETDTWTTGLPRFGMTVLSEMLYAVDDKGFYSIGGFRSGITAVANVGYYDIATNTWLTKASLPIALKSSTVFSLDNINIVVAGGTNNANSTSDKVYVYNVIENQWFADIPPETKPFMSVPATVIDGKMFTYGGYVDGVSYTQDMLTYTNDEKWVNATQLGTKPTGRSGHGWASSKGSLFLTCGRYGPFLKDTWLFTPKSS